MKNLFKQSWQKQTEYNQQTFQNIEHIQNFLATNPNQQQMLNFLNDWKGPQQLSIQDQLFSICLGA